MPVRAYELSDGGVVLACSTTGVPLPLSKNLFRDEEQAEWFLASLLPRDARAIEAGELQTLAALWASRRLTEAAIESVADHDQTDEEARAELASDGVDVDAFVARVEAEVGSVCGEYPAVPK